MSSDLQLMKEMIGRKSFRDAVAFADRVLQDSPADLQIRLLKATALAELARFPEALAEVDTSLAQAESPPWTWRLLRVNLLRDGGDPERALGAAEDLQREHPDKAVIHNLVGVLLRDRGRLDAAVGAFVSARQAEPAYALAYLNAARVYQEIGASSTASEEIRLGLRSCPGDPDLNLMLATVYESEGRTVEANAQYRHTASLRPRSMSDVYKGLARTAYAQADLYGAIRAYQTASEFASDDWTIWNGIGNCHLDLGLLAEAEVAYRRAMELRPDIAGLHDNLLLCHLYDPAVDPEQMFQEHRAWEARFAAAPFARESEDRSRGNEKLRLAFISHAFNQGPTGFFLQPLLRNLDRGRYSLHAYSVGLSADATTDELRLLFDTWSDVGELTDEGIARRIRDDKVDLLVDLSGHAPGNRLKVMSYRPAPRSATWLDYVNTTGLSTVDYFVGDTVSIPETTPQRFAERVVRVGACRLCYSPPSYLPAVTELPMKENGYPTFGSFNRVSKMTEPTLDMWCALLRTVADARLILKSGIFANAETRANFLERFERRGVDVRRITLRDISPHPQMLAEYGDIDISLDTLPFNGGLTTCESLIMGVPVVALLGDVLVSRQSAALLTAAGLPDLVVAQPDDWLQRHLDLLNDLEDLAARRRVMRPLVLASDLCDGMRFAQQFEAALLDFRT